MDCLQMAYGTRFAGAQAGESVLWLGYGCGADEQGVAEAAGAWG